MLYSSISSGDQWNRNQSQFFVFAVAAAVSLIVISRQPDLIVPICGWLMFLGMLLDLPMGRWARAVLPLFNNPVAQFIGRISYSLYLCHSIAIILAQAALVHLWPGLPKPVHCLSLLAATLVISVALSYVSYTLIESPGIRLGRQLAAPQTHLPATAVIGPSMSRTTVDQNSAHDQPGEAIIVRDPCGVIRYWSKEARLMYGWTPQEVLGLCTRDLFKTQFPKSLAAIEQQTREQMTWQGASSFTSVATVQRSGSTVAGTSCITRKPSRLRLLKLMQ